jgi:hypothetical protein
MPTVETTITASIPDDGVTLAELEERVAQAVQQVVSRTGAASGGLPVPGRAGSGGPEPSGATGRR